jgi:NAD/NADP transhydrogenase alpha subunit
MKPGPPRETRSGETRVAVTSDTVKKLRAKGLEILIEEFAGIESRR